MYIMYIIHNFMYDIIYIYIHIISINSVDSHPCMMRANCQAWQLVPLQL